MPDQLEIPDDLPDEVTNRGLSSDWYRNQETRSVISTGGGKKKIGLQKLEDVWGESPMRINNKFDTLDESKNLIEEIINMITGISTVKKDPFTGKQVLARLVKIFNKNDEGYDKDLPYSLVSNNCEHFASYVRNGVRVSAQVNNVIDAMRPRRPFEEVTNPLGLGLSLMSRVLTREGLGQTNQQQQQPSGGFFGFEPERK